MDGGVIAPATLSGLRDHPCDPLILAIRADGRPLRGLTGQVDWRLSGVLTRMVKAGNFNQDVPILKPPSDLLPCGRLILWRVGTATPNEMAQLIAGLNAPRPGLCPGDFEFSETEAQHAFGGRLIVYRNPT
jgi:hypothetical protein